MNIRENNKKERNLKENHKSFWKKFNEKWLWVNIGSYIVGTILFWLLFFTGIIKLMTVIFLTILNFLIMPLMYYFFNYFRESKHKNIIAKIAYIGCGGYLLGLIIWLLTSSALLNASWAPLHSLPQGLKTTILLLLMVPSYGVAVYIMYRIGKKRDWKLASIYYIEK